MNQVYQRCKLPSYFMIFHLSGILDVPSTTVDFKIAMTNLALGHSDRKRGVPSAVSLCCFC